MSNEGGGGQQQESTGWSKARTREGEEGRKNDGEAATQEVKAPFLD